MILATALIGALGVVALDSAGRNRRAVDARNIGEYMASFQSAALNYVADVNNNPAIIAAAKDGTGAAAVCVGNYVNSGTFDTLNNVTKKTCAVDASWLIFKGFLPPSFKLTNSLGQAPVAVYRLVYISGVPTTNIERFVAGDSAVGTKTYPTARGFTLTQDAFTAANLMGTSMGVVPDNAATPGCVWDPSVATNRDACGTQGAWKVRLSDFIN